VDYRSVLLKDKGDLVSEVLSLFPSINVLGTYEKPTLDKSKIKILSVKYSKVGKKTLSDYPNLKSIICRSHGIDNVNEGLTSERNIEVLKTNPNGDECSKWLYDKIEPNNKNILIFGDGSISKKLQRKLNDEKVRVVDTKTSSDKINIYLNEADCIVSTLPLNKSTEKYFNDVLLDKINKPTQLLSISRKNVFENGFITSDKFYSVDTDEEHISWKYKLNEDGKYYSEYGNNLKSIIDGCPKNNNRTL